MVKAISLKAKVPLVLLAFVFAAIAGALMASPAQADREYTGPAGVESVENTGGDVAVQTSADCVYYLQLAGYTVGPKRTQNCNTGASGSQWAELFCYLGLVDGGVSEYHAGNACRLAQR